MMFFMDSKVLEKYFLNIERDQDILKAQYVLVSCRIRVSDTEKYDNILNAKNELFPDPEVCSAIDEDTFKERYYEQLNENITLIAFLIKGCIKENFNIIFLCSEKEGKIKYLQYLADYILMEFDYPVYNYKKYCQNKTEDIRFNREVVLKRCNNIINEKKQESLDKIDDKEILRDIKKLKKDSLKKELKNRGLYKKGLTKSQMRDLLEFDII